MRKKMNCISQIPHLNIRCAIERHGPAPQRNGNHNHRDGTIRRNPYRNQIDYVLTKTKHKEFVNESRPYNGFETSPDHKLLKAKFQIKWYKTKTNQPKVIKPNLQMVQNQNKSTKGNQT